MITNSNSLFRERDAQSFGRRPTSRHGRFRAFRVRTEFNQLRILPIVSPHPVQPNREFSGHGHFGDPFFRHIIRCTYRRRQSWLHRAAACAASPSKKRNNVLPCLLTCPSRCRRALESSHGMARCSCQSVCRKETDRRPNDENVNQPRDRSHTGMRH